jgi:hypothetical protein
MLIVQSRAMTLSLLSEATWQTAHDWRIPEIAREWFC